MKALLPHLWRCRPFHVNWHVFCGSGFPAATIEAESLSHKKTKHQTRNTKHYSLADNLTPGVMA
jgi:hypothetical protein